MILLYVSLGPNQMKLIVPQIHYALFQYYNFIHAFPPTGILFINIPPIPLGRIHMSSPAIEFLKYSVSLTRPNSFK